MLVCTLLARPPQGKRFQQLQLLTHYRSMPRANRKKTPAIQRHLRAAAEAEAHELRVQMAKRDAERPPIFRRTTVQWDWTCGACSNLVWVGRRSCGKCGDPRHPRVQLHRLRARRFPAQRGNQRRSPSPAASPRVRPCCEALPRTANCTMRRRANCKPR